MTLNQTQHSYLKQLREMPQPGDAPEWWPKWMTELHAAGLIQRIGRSIYLTETGHMVAENLS